MAMRCKRPGREQAKRKLFSVVVATVIVIFVIAIILIFNKGISGWEKAKAKEKGKNLKSTFIKISFINGLIKLRLAF